MVESYKKVWGWETLCNSPLRRTGKKKKKKDVVQSPTCQNQHSSEWRVWMEVPTAITISKTVDLPMKKSAKSPSFGTTW